MIQSRECFAGYVKSVEIHLLQPGVHGSLGVFEIGTTQQSNSKTTARQWHRDAVIQARMTEQGEQQSVLQLQCSAAAKEAEQRRVKNRTVLLKLLRSIYFLAKNRLLLTTTLIRWFSCKLLTEMNSSSSMWKKGLKMLSTHPSFQQ